MNYTVTKVGVLGAGVMGAGIAGWVAGAGIPVVLLDRVPAELGEEDKTQGLTKDSTAFRSGYAQRGLARISDKKSGVLYAPEMADYITTGNFEDDLQLLSDCDLILEVVAENLEIKHRLLKKIIPYIGEHTIVASNTSGIPISKIAAVFQPAVRERFLGIHFFNPPRYMRLLEVIPGAETKQDVLEFIIDFATTILGKGVVVAKDTPNFIANRVGTFASTLVLNSFREYGLSLEDVDSLTGTLIGRAKSATFGTLDLVGLDILATVASNLVAAIPEEKNNFTLPDFYRELLGCNQLGNKTGEGFYRRTREKNADGTRITYVWNIETKEYECKKGPSSSFAKDQAKERDLAKRLGRILDSDDKEGRFLWNYFKRFFLYCATTMEEISDHYEKIDQAMRWGYNWTLGPFQIWQAVGFKKICCKILEEGDQLPPWILEMLESGELFYKNLDPDTIIYPVIKEFTNANLVDFADGIIGFEIQSPGNSITEQLKNDLVEAITLLEQTPSYRGLVLFNQRQHFLTGADLKAFNRKLETQDYANITQGVESFHQVSRRIKFARKPIVAAIHDMVLGGGYEFSIACSRIVAHVDTAMGLVEAGVGIIPGGGGLKELLVLATKDLLAYPSLDHRPMVLKYWRSIATGQVSRNAFHGRAMGYLRPTDRIVLQKSSLVAVAKEEALRLAEDGYRQSIPAKIPVTGTDGYDYLLQVIGNLREENQLSEYDAVVGEKIAFALTGGDVPVDTILTEDELLALEQKGIEELVRNDKTKERIAGMVRTGRAVRN